MNKRFFVSSGSGSTDCEGYSIISVSYTHLDVYKRQNVDWTIITYGDKIYNGIMDEIELMGYYDSNNYNNLCVDNNDACYKYVRYIYDDGG